MTGNKKHVLFEFLKDSLVIKILKTNLKVGILKAMKETFTKIHENMTLDKLFLYKLLFNVIRYD